MFRGAPISVEVEHAHIEFTKSNIAMAFCFDTLTKSDAEPCLVNIEYNADN